MPTYIKHNKTPNHPIVATAALLERMANKGDLSLFTGVLVDGTIVKEGNVIAIPVPAEPIPTAPTIPAEPIPTAPTILAESVDDMPEIDLAKIENIILACDALADSDYNLDGTPKVDALIAILGIPISKVERDMAWHLKQGQG